MMKVTIEIEHGLTSAPTQ